MRVFYDEENVCIEIAIDYCDEEAMKKLCKIIVYQEDARNLWKIEGIYLNHALGEDDISEAQKRLGKLFSEKGKNMNVTEKRRRSSKDHIILSKEELMEYFAFFAVYYMQVKIRPQNDNMNIIDFGTESDANYVYIKMKNTNKINILEVLQYVGIEKLNLLTCKEYDFVWSDNVFENIEKFFPEIGAYIENKMSGLKEDGWIKSEEYIKTHVLKKEMKLIYLLEKVTGETVEIPMLKILCQHKKPELMIVPM